MNAPRPRAGPGRLLAAALALAVLLPFAGGTWIAPAEILEGADPATLTIFWQLRVPRVLLALVAGAGLAAGGAVFQALFRNPLATPFTLGTASGAGLGAALAMSLGGGIVLLGLPGSMWGAFAGALLALGAVLVLSVSRWGRASETLLLFGVALAVFCSSLILMIQYLSDQAHSLGILRWLMGGLAVTGYREVLVAALFCVPGCALVAAFARGLDLLASGETLAATRGLDVGRAKALLLVVVGLMVGAVVAATGPVGFVGLIAPHVARRLFGAGHARMLPAALMLGGLLLAVCDVLARSLLAPAELPVGILTALLGGPFFVWVLISNPAASS